MSQDFSPFEKRNGARYHVLLVDDNALNLTMATHTLETLGCRVDTASSGEEAAAMLRRFPCYDVVFMDCIMPEMDGYETTRKIRHFEEFSDSQHRTPIIALTSKTRQGEQQRCLNAGMNDYLSKPLRAESARAMLYRWCDSEAVDYRQKHQW